MKETAFFILIILFCISCNHHDPVTFSRIENISCESQKTSPFMGLPMSMKVFNNQLFISDFHGDSLIIRYDLKSQTEIGRFASRGNGPNEFISPIFLFVSDSALFIQSMGNRIFGYLPGSIYEEAETSTFKSLFNVPEMAVHMFPLDSQRFLATGFFEQGRYAILNDRGEIVSYFGSYPEYLKGEKDRPTINRGMYHQVMYEANYPAKKLICLSGHVLEILDFSSEVPKSVESILLSPYDYDYSPNNFISAKSKENTVFGAVAISSTENYVYVVYNPNTPGNKLTPADNEIWVFDWKGTPVRKLIPDKNINNIVAINDQLLYGISDLPDPTLVRIRF